VKIYFEIRFAIQHNIDQERKILEFQIGTGGQNSDNTPLLEQ
jgi:hypothetical protein